MKNKKLTILCIIGGCCGALVTQTIYPKQSPESSLDAVEETTPEKAKQNTENSDRRPAQRSITKDILPSDAIADEDKAAAEDRLMKKHLIKPAWSHPLQPRRTDAEGEEG